jgi:release factor glutamine methyltransferase
VDRSRAQVAGVTERLAAAGCVAPEAEAGHLCGLAPDAVTLDGWVRRRSRGEPLAWVTGRVDFAGRTLTVTPGVYVPRPHTEELVARVAAVAQVGARVADLCTGTGAVATAVRAEVPGARVVGVDVDARAVACARRNGVLAVRGDLGAPLRAAAFDLVASVAPYVPTSELRLLPADVQRHEPRAALDGGVAGLEVVIRVVADAARLLRPSGRLVLELGGDQDVALAPVLDAHGFEVDVWWHDEDGDLRGVVATSSDRPTSASSALSPSAA